MHEYMYVCMYTVCMYAWRYLYYCCEGQLRCVCEGDGLNQRRQFHFIISFQIIKLHRWTYFAISFIRLYVLSQNTNKRKATIHQQQGEFVRKVFVRQQERLQGNTYKTHEKAGPARIYRIYASHYLPNFPTFFFFWISGEVPSNMQKSI